MKIKKCLVLTFLFVPLLYSCNPESEITGNNAVNNNQIKSPVPFESDISSSPLVSPTSTPVPIVTSTILPTATPQATVAPPLPTATPAILQVDLDNSTGIWELHKGGTIDAYLAICEKEINIVARQSGIKFTNDVKFNDTSDFTGYKRTFDTDPKTKVITYNTSLIQEYISEGHPELNTTYEWVYNYKQGRMYDLKLIITNLGSNTQIFSYDAVLLSNTFNRADIKGNFIETCSNYKKS